MKTKSNRGGARPNSGPKLHGDKPKKTVSLTLSQNSIDKLNMYKELSGVSKSMIVDELIDTNLEFTNTTSSTIKMVKGLSDFSDFAEPYDCNLLGDFSKPPKDF